MDKTQTGYTQRLMIIVHTSPQALPEGTSCKSKVPFLI